MNKINVKSVVGVIVGIVAVKLFGALETIIGAAVAALIIKILSGKHPGATWVFILAYAVGAVLAFVLSVAAGMILYQYM